MRLEFTEYDALITALKDRASELNLTYETIEAVSGLQTGYVAKLFSPRRIRRLGEVSMGLMLQTLALKLVLVRDDEQAQKMRKFWAERKHAPAVRARACALPNPVTHNPRMAREAANKRWAKTPPEKRSRYARKAAKARWRKYRTAMAM